MEFRYDFLGAKLDLERWRRQAKHYISIGMQRLTYYLYFKHYKIQVNIETPNDTTTHMVSFAIMELGRDVEGEIQVNKMIYPTTDSRFKEFKDIAKFFSSRMDIGEFRSNSAQFTVDELSKVIKYVFKVENLKAFI